MFLVLCLLNIVMYLVLCLGILWYDIYLIPVYNVHDILEDFSFFCWWYPRMKSTMFNNKADYLWNFN